jgi:hypothetical protein
MHPSCTALVEMALAQSEILNRQALRDPMKASHPENQIAVGARVSSPRMPGDLGACWPLDQLAPATHRVQSQNSKTKSAVAIYKPSSAQVKSVYHAVVADSRDP